MRRYNQRLFRAIRSVIASDADADDVLQEAWVRAWKGLPGASSHARPIPPGRRDSNPPRPAWEARLPVCLCCPGAQGATVFS